MLKLTVAVVAVLLMAAVSRADTVLVEVTPQSLPRSTFRVTSKAGKDRTIEFTIRRDVAGIEVPASKGYTSYPAIDGRGLGVPVKMEREGTTMIFRFAVPVDRVTGEIFTLWGNGQIGENVTYRFQLARFWKPS